MDYVQALATAKIVNYLKKEEERNYEESNMPANHIYHDVMTLAHSVQEFCSNNLNKENPYITDAEMKVLTDLIA